MKLIVTQKQLASYRRGMSAASKARKLGATIKAAILDGANVEAGKFDAALVDVSKGVDWKAQFETLCEEHGIDPIEEMAEIQSKCRRKAKRLCVTTHAA
jgi:hypothetical protein